MKFTKDPNAELDYMLDWSAWLAGDVIAESEWIVDPSLTLIAHSYTDATATVWVGGGIADTDVLVTNRITTVGGRQDDRTITLKIRER